MRKLFIFFALFTHFSFANASRAERDTSIQLLKNELWWGGSVIFGTEMPFGKKDFSFDLSNHTGNQNAPVLISNKGRWIWSEKAFAYSFANDSLRISNIFGKMEIGQSGNDLKTAYQYCSKNFFPSSGKWVDSLLITAPQYNLWIELMYDPTQKLVLKYANPHCSKNAPNVKI